MSTGATVVAVNGLDYTPAALEDAVTAATKDKQPIKLLLKHQGGTRTAAVDYDDGLEYPPLPRITGTPNDLSQIIAARK